jgi:hypothetical protein
MGALAAMVSAAIARFFLAEGVKWVAFKALLLVLTMTVLPIVLKNVFYDLLSAIMTAVNNKVGSVGTGSIGAVTAEVTGMGGWLAVQLMLPECFSLMLSAVAFRLTLKLTFAFFGPKF